MLPGHVTPEGTTRYRDRFLALRDADHFRRQEHVPGAGELWLSSIGLGTYLGETDDAADTSYTESVTHALRFGINVLDTAINYRHQRSERNIGAALDRLVAAGELQRDEVVVCTKAGYLSFDGNMPADPSAYFRSEYVEKGVLDPAAIAGGMHCMAPRYLEDQLERSRRNLRLETIDVFYVHNPESQLASVDRATFRKRLKQAFEMLERAVKSGKIRWYGAATWNAFRIAPSERDYLSLAEVIEVAREVAGDRHHFRFIQLPFNLAMPEAYALRNQNLAKQAVSTLEVAAREGIMVVGSASLYQGHLTSGLPDSVGQRLGMESDAANAIQFARSAPGLAVALVGMGQKQHVEENVQVAARPPALAEEWKQLFTRAA
ncbi:MAG TPA: aldo/keto reductase [Terriglobales bacterium]|jgi:aryl-alcohol dehydrogenase-like predicted oxidoreductase|nr:aldo/keto reductase [Terriglobales bacterium]